MERPAHLRQRDVHVSINDGGIDENFGAEIRPRLYDSHVDEVVEPVGEISDEEEEVSDEYAPLLSMHELAGKEKEPGKSSGVLKRTWRIARRFVWVLGCLYLLFSLTMIFIFVRPSPSLNRFCDPYKNCQTDRLGYYIFVFVSDKDGLPLSGIEVRTLNEISAISDENGAVLFYEPGLMAQAVYFTLNVSSFQSHVVVNATRAQMECFHLSISSGLRDTLLYASKVPIDDDKKTTQCTPAPNSYFGLDIRDAETDSGLPFVSITCDRCSETYVTDSSGICAFHESDLMYQLLTFEIFSPGYDNLTIQVFTQPGIVTRFRLLRTGNLARRIMRLTGQGSFRDSFLLSMETPVLDPVDGGGLMQAATAQCVRFHERLMCFWKEAVVIANPTTHNLITGGVSSGMTYPNEHTYLDRKIEFVFFERFGIIKPLVDPVEFLASSAWVDSLVVFHEGSEQKLHAILHAETAQGLKHWFCVFDSRKVEFRKDIVPEVDEKGFALLSQSLEEEKGVTLGPYDARVDVDPMHGEFVYIGRPFPLARVTNVASVFIQPQEYEYYTPLVEGSRLDDKVLNFERDENGSLLYSWKSNTSAIHPIDQEILLRRGVITESDKPMFFLNDMFTGEKLVIRSGALQRDKENNFVFVGEPVGQNLTRDSGNGDVVGSYSKSLTGPWYYARTIVRHDRGFFDVFGHPVVEGGDFIFFEGSLHPTSLDQRVPRYDHTTLLYSMNMTDAAVYVPLPVLGASSYVQEDVLLFAAAPPTDDDPLVFFAPPEKNFDSFLTDLLRCNVANASGWTFFAGEPDENDCPDAQVVGRVRVADPYPSMLPLFGYAELVNLPSKQVTWYAVNGPEQIGNLTRHPDPVAFVWPFPTLKDMPTKNLDDYYFT